MQVLYPAAHFHSIFLLLLAILLLFWLALRFVGIFGPEGHIIWTTLIIEVSDYRLAIEVVRVVDHAAATVLVTELLMHILRVILAIILIIVLHFIILKLMFHIWSVVWHRVTKLTLNTVIWIQVEIIIIILVVEACAFGLLLWLSLHTMFLLLVRMICLDAHLLSLLLGWWLSQFSSILLLDYNIQFLIHLWHSV